MQQNNDIIYIALGANLSNPKDTFPNAIRDLEAVGLSVIAKSGLWRSPAWPPGSDAPDYINAVISVHFSGGPEQLLSELHNIEREHGRVRGARNAPRTLDLDILDFRGEVVELPHLTIPHPRMLTRGFVLLPLSQIAPGWHDPIQNRSVYAHITQLPLTEIEPMTYLGPME